MSSTAEQVLAALAMYDLKREGKEWRCNSPLRPGSNSHAFKVTIEDGEHGAYHDHVSGDHGSLYELAKHLGIALPERESEQRKGYSGLAEYAQAHGVTEDAFIAAGWSEVTYQGRPAFRFQTSTGVKFRFTDGKDPKFKPMETGYQFCLYGLKHGISMAHEKGVLVITNGEPSVIAAQHFGIPAICHTGGENKHVPESLIEHLNTLYQGDVIVALDCDKAGREGAVKWQKALVNGGYHPRVVDMRLMDKGDLADFCMLYEGSSLDALRNCDDLNPQTAPLPETQEERLIVTRSETMADFTRQLFDSYVPDAPPMINPLKVLHKFGGECHVMDTGQLMGVIGSSGTGKTSMLETIMDALLRLEKNILAWSPEWKPYQLAQRAIQRYEGPTMEALRLHKLWQWEKAHGVTNHQGRPLSQQVISAAFDKAEELAGFAGDVAYVPNNILTIDRFIEQYPKMLEQFGKPLHALVIDYVQLMHSLEKTDVSMYDTLMKIRHMCMQYGLVGFVASQTTKAATSGQKEMKLLDGTMARFVNEDAFNVIVTINPEFNAMGEWLHSGVLKVDKNSSGRKGMVRVKMNLSLLSWIDEETPNQDFSQYMDK